MKRFSKVLALTIVFIMMMSTTAMAAEVPGKIISNTLEASFKVGVSNEMNVGNVDELKEALGNENITVINILNNIEGITEPIMVDRDGVTINGNENTLKFEGLESIATTTDDGLIISGANVIVNNLKVDAGLESPGNWVGTYAIHVYDTTNVTLNNVTATGGNGGILVNGSGVKLEGTINVSGNGFGGIEVSGDTVGAANLSLDINGATIVNNSEAPGKPTIWEDKVSECVEGADGYHSIRVLKDGNSQVHYYIEKENSQFIELKWNQEPTETMESPFVITVTAENKVKEVAIPNVLYIVEVDGGVFEAVELVNGEEKQKLGYDSEGGFWYWGNRENGFTFNFENGIAATTFQVTAGQGNYDVNIYAVQLDKE